MARRHNRTVVLMIKGGTAKINKPNVRALNATHLATLQKMQIRNRLVMII